MRAVILVGGEGTRLRPLTLTTPKQMLPIAEVSMIERVIAQLARHGVHDVVLSMGYKPDAFLKAFPDNACAGIPLIYAIEPEPRDTAGAIAFAARYAEIDETFIVVNGDVLTDCDTSALLALHRESNAEATIGLTPVDDPSQFGVVPTDPDGRVQAFIEKPSRETAPTNFINAGTYILEPGVLDLIPDGRRVSIERETFPALVENKAMFALASDAYWLDTGTPEKYLQANLDYVRGLRGSEPPAPGARESSGGVWQIGDGTIEGHIEPNSLIGRDATIAETAVVIDSIIGAGARIEANAVIHESVILPGAVIASDTQIDTSIIGEGAKVQRGVTLSDYCVVGGGQEVPADTHHANARIGNA